jgi:D-amino peptidase
VAPAWFNDDWWASSINAALCGHYGCPVALVTGDEAVIRECREILGDGFTGVAVKRGLSRYSARQIPPARAQHMIEEGAEHALKNLKAVRPYAPARPTTITVELTHTDQAADFKGRYGVELVSPLKVVSRGKDWMEAWDQIWGW